MPWPQPIPTTTGALTQALQGMRGNLWNARYQFGVTDPDSGVFSPTNLTGCGLRMQIRDAARNLVLDLSTERTTLAVEPGSLGWIAFAVPSAATLALVPGFYDYDLMVIWSDGEPDTHLGPDRFEVLENITNPNEAP